MTQFCHISPTQYLDEFCKSQTTHLVLAHLVEQDKKYRDWYRINKMVNPNHIYIMDNSQFEMTKQGRESFPSEKLIEMGKEINADYIVMSDYPGRPAVETIEIAKKLAPKMKDAGFKTFFCPQSKPGDKMELLQCFNWAANSKLVDYIGVSILAVPIAYGGEIESKNKLQRFLSRWHFMNDLYETNILSTIVENNKKVHFLGMLDGPNEIMLVAPYIGYIDTWDSSAAVWAGLNGIRFDNSPTGLINGKFEKHVIFEHNTAKESDINLAKYNVQYINDLIGKYS